MERACLHASRALGWVLLPYSCGGRSYDYLRLTPREAQKMSIWTLKQGVRGHDSALAMVKRPSKSVLDAIIHTQCNTHTGGGDPPLLQKSADHQFFAWQRPPIGVSQGFGTSTEHCPHG